MIAVGAVLALLAAAAWLVPGMMDWSRYRDTIASLAAQRLGRPVRIGGTVTLQLLPQPILTATDVSVEDAGDGIGLRAKALRLRVALGPLLGGHVDTRELTLQGADMRLPWPPPPGALAQRPPSWITALRARIEDGRIQVGSVEFTSIEATLTQDPDTGTVSVAGVGQAGGQAGGQAEGKVGGQAVGGPTGGNQPDARAWQFTARLARPGRDGSAGLDVSLDGQGRLRDTGGTFSGQIAADGALSGRVAGRGPDLSLLLPAPAVPWRGDGRLSAAGGLAVADELALEIGGAPARGAVALRVAPQARLDLAIAAGRLDLDAWLPALLSDDNGIRGGIPTGVDLSAEAATLAGGTLRQLRGALDLGQGAILLRDVEAILPGEARLSLSGQVSTLSAPQAQKRFEGAVRLVAPDLRATLRWAQRILPPSMANLPPGLLRAAELSGRVTAQGGLLQIDDLAGTLDGSRVTGAATFRPGTRPGVTANLALNQLQAAPWVPPGLLSPDGAPALLEALRGADLDLKLQIARAEWGTLGLGAVAIELQSEASRVFLRRLEAQPAGARLSASGQIAAGGRLSDGRIEVTAPDLRALRPVLAELPPLPFGLDVLLRGQGSARISLAGPPEALAARIALEASDLHIEAQPVLNLPAQRGAGPILLHHPGAPRLLELLGLGGTVAWLGDGSLSLVGQAAWTPGRLELDSATLAAGALRTGLRLVLEGRSLTGVVTAETLPLPIVYPRSPDPLPLAWLRQGNVTLRVEAAQVLAGLTPLMQGVSADLALSDGTLRLTRLAGRAAGGSFAGTTTVDAAADPPRITLEGQATGLSVTGALFETPLDFAAGQFDLTAALTAAGHSPAALLATLDGRAFLRGKDGVMTGFDVSATGTALAAASPREATASARAALSAGSTPFTTLEAPLTASRGAISTEARLAGPAGEVTLNGAFDLMGGGLDLRIGVAPAVVNAPKLGVRVSGPAAAPVRTPELAGLALWLADRPP